MLKAWNSRNAKLLPYDTEVEWIRANGSQFIDTLISPNKNGAYYLRCLYNSNPAQAFQHGINEDYGPDVRFVFTLQGGYCHIYNRYILNTEGGVGRIGNVIEYLIDFKNKKTFIRDLSDDREASCTGVEHVFTGEEPENIFLFARNDGYGNPELFCDCRLYEAIFYENDVEVFHAIPVRFRTEGMLYDSVSGQLFRNSGTGAFEIGPDK